MSGIHHHVPELSRLDLERAQDLLGDVRRKRLATRAFDHFSEQPVADV